MSISSLETSSFCFLPVYAIPHGVHFSEIFQTWWQVISFLLAAVFWLHGWIVADMERNRRGEAWRIRGREDHLLCHSAKRDTPFCPSNKDESSCKALEQLLPNCTLALRWENSIEFLRGMIRNRAYTGQLFHQQLSGHKIHLKQKADWVSIP